MTREETIKMLSILKAAYPNSYRGMTKDEANGTITVWSMQFANIPANIMMIAINKLISTNPFPPAISEVKNKLRDLYYEAKEMLTEHKYATEGIKISNNPDEAPMYIGNALDEKSLKVVNDIIAVTENMRLSNNNETKLSEMLTYNNNYYLEEKNGK